MGVHVVSLQKLSQYIPRYLIVMSDVILQDLNATYFHL